MERRSTAGGVRQGRARRRGRDAASVRTMNVFCETLPAFGAPVAMMSFAQLWPILIVVLLLFGARKLPELAHAMGASINQFKKGLGANPEDEDKKKLEGGTDEK
jgi:sec-independent protein translocase protein TatA